MSDWYRIHISNQENIAGKQFQVQDAFTPIIMVNTAPKEFALFSAYNSDDGTVDVFVSPQLASVTSSLLACFNAQVCEKPESGSVGLLSGNQYALEFFELRERKL